MLTILLRRVAPRATAWAPPARTPAARSWLWAMTVHHTQAEFAPNLPEGMWASGPSIRSAKTVSMITCWRWGDVGLGDRKVGVGEERVIAPHREQGVAESRVFDAAHDQPRGEPVLGGRESGVADLGDFSIGDPVTGVGIPDRAGITHRRPGGLVDQVDGPVDRGVAGSYLGHRFTLRITLVRRVDSPI